MYKIGTRRHTVHMLAMANGALLVSSALADHNASPDRNAPSHSQDRSAAEPVRTVRIVWGRNDPVPMMAATVPIMSAAVTPSPARCPARMCNDANPRRAHASSPA